MTEVEAPWVAAQSDSITHIDTRRIHSGCWVALIAIAIVRAWFTRYELVVGDSLAYLDIAREVAGGHPGAAIHAYWSPGYPGAALILAASREVVGADYEASRSPFNASIAAFLLNNGLYPGDGVALIGNGTEAYWGAPGPTASGGRNPSWYRITSRSPRDGFLGVRT
jgi:hypothetical protein